VIEDYDAIAFWLLTRTDKQRVESLSIVEWPLLAQSGRSQAKHFVTDMELAESLKA
jgi:hypothetical protein